MAFHIKRKHDLKISTMFSSEKFCKSVVQEGSVSSHLAAVRVKFSSIKDQGVFASYFFFKVKHEKETEFIRIRLKHMNT